MGHVPRIDQAKVLERVDFIINEDNYEPGCKPRKPREQFCQPVLDNLLPIDHHEH